MAGNSVKVDLIEQDQNGYIFSVEGYDAKLGVQFRGEVRYEGGAIHGNLVDPRETQLSTGSIMNIRYNIYRLVEDLK